MILAFQEQFVAPILAGTKIHTIRTDEHDRWKAGCNIEMATGVRTKNYNLFKRATCISTEWVEVCYVKFYNINGSIKEICKVVWLHGRELIGEELEDFAISDGFANSIDFFAFYNKDYKGKLIHWTDKKYRK
jgi:uncharacterized protein YqfB (UPF0267 family)